MLDLAPDLRLLPSRPAYAFNVYVAGGTIVDAATRHALRRILRDTASLRITAHAVTHGHSDHQGSSAALVRQLGIPFWAPAGEAEALRSGRDDALTPQNPITRWQARHWRGPAVAVDRELVEGDELDAGFVALETPGHSPGHLSYWREEDRTLIAGDVLFGRHPITGRPGLHEPPSRFTIDPARNRASIRRVAELRPALVVFGHGRPHRDPEALLRFAAALPDDAPAAPPTPARV
ncbi:MAG TPA: MBL fold metallo-hydrolase [Baekduia sp.]|uniref:MBL fold metallo-hydrolase n=1 Tax=Baekduia sp. TaxID=2600305 RepID=UPI002D78C4E0|nr:MBL fold metallo-hydrolase [Baekduia sp.]HET6510287.1 MBL fold metallo-hydrolase [Baekduia sp.]